jgi:hypothetical protein
MSVRDQTAGTALLGLLGARFFAPPHQDQEPQALHYLQVTVTNALAYKDLATSKAPVGSQASEFRNTCPLQIRVFDGTRSLLTSSADVLYRVFGGDQKEVVEVERRTSILNCEFEFHNNFTDAYSVVVYANGYQ